MSDLVANISPFWAIASQRTSKEMLQPNDESESSKEATPQLPRSVSYVHLICRPITVQCSCDDMHLAIIRGTSTLKLLLILLAQQGHITSPTNEEIFPVLDKASVIVKWTFWESSLHDLFSML